MILIEFAPKKTNIAAPSNPIARETTVPNLKSLIGRKIRTNPIIPRQIKVIMSTEVGIPIVWELR